MIEINKNIQYIENLKVVDPTDHTTFVSMGGIDYIIGALLIIIGITIFVLFNKKAKINAQIYKNKQLEQYNKNRNSKVTDYNRTKLFLPFWEKTKFVTPIMLTITFIFVGVTWIIWTATGVPVTTI